MISSLWQSLLSGPLRARTLEIVSRVAERLDDPEHIFAIAQIAARQSAVPQLDPNTLTFGPSGPVLACSYLHRCFPDQGWDIIAHRYLDTSRTPGVCSHPALYGGRSGLGFVLTLLNEDGTRYRKTCAQLNQRLCTQILQQPGPPGACEE